MKTDGIGTIKVVWGKMEKEFPADLPAPQLAIAMELTKVVQELADQMGIVEINGKNFEPVVDVILVPWDM